MKPRLLALRAIATTFALGILRSAAIWAGVAVLVLIIIIGLLAYFFSNWWWLLAMPIGVATIVGLVIWLILNFILRHLQPSMTKDQKTATQDFIEKAERLFENATTPYPLLAARLVFDTVFRRKDGLLSEVIADSKGLRQELNKVSAEF